MIRFIGTNLHRLEGRQELWAPSVNTGCSTKTPAQRTSPGPNLPSDPLENATVCYPLLFYRGANAFWGSILLFELSKTPSGSGDVIWPFLPCHSQACLSQIFLLRAPVLGQTDTCPQLCGKGRRRAGRQEQRHFAFEKSKGKPISNCL